MISQLKNMDIFVNKVLQIFLILLQIRMTVVYNILCLLVFTLKTELKAQPLVTEFIKSMH